MDQMAVYSLLIERAQRGDRESLDELAGRVRPQLYAYVYRMVLDEQLAQDIVQESLLEMVKALDRLDKSDGFWSWLRRIAFNRIRRLRAQQKRQGLASKARLEHRMDERRRCQAGLADLLAQELRELVTAAMRQLKPAHRQVLAMRCYEEMSYAEIAELMGCSELGARVLFCRAKRALAKELSRKGLGKGFLVTALVLFGKITAPSEAAAAEMTLTAETLKAGLTATVGAWLCSRAVLTTLSTAAIVAVGTTVVAPQLSTTPSHRAALNSKTVAAASGDFADDVRTEQRWYYHPLGARGPVMLRIFERGRTDGQIRCRWWQDGKANYYFDERHDTIAMVNARFLESSLQVLRLPTDSPALRNFLAAMDGMPTELGYVGADGPGLLVVTERGLKVDRALQVVRHYNMLSEEYSRYQWPAGASLLDQRDALHREGWGYFEISGQLGHEPVSGLGRIPFVWTARTQHYPWLCLELGRRLRIEDDGTTAAVCDATGKLIARYAGGSFWLGLARPWMGLHALDVVRRDAAAAQMPFETCHSPGQPVAEVQVTCPRGRLYYKIDLLRDIILEIEIQTEPAADGQPIGGKLKFEYLPPSAVQRRFVEPRLSQHIGPVDNLSVTWLLDLLTDRWR